MKVWAVCCPTKHNVKYKDFYKYFSTLDSKFIAGEEYNSKKKISNNLRNNK